jgi:SAM-dependent methyltransferase
MIARTRHLDLGCGPIPRNPYGRDETYGCDILPLEVNIKISNNNYRQANLILESIPFPDNHFDSVSAFDFLEHVPRYVVLSSGASAAPFINLMNEIFRVLKPGGVFFASTPAYPHSAAFSDPTHVNIITDQTHRYFVGVNPTARIYGFVGNFQLNYSRWDTPHNADYPFESWPRKFFRRMHRRILRDGLSHMFWEFIAKKSTGA